MITASDITFIVTAIVLALILVTVYFLENRVRKDKEEYISTLNEHDKAVITDYLSKGRYFRKRVKKNDESTKEDK